MRGSDRPPFDDGEIAAPRREIGAHHQEPVHALGLRAEELGAAPFRKAADQEMRGAADELQRAVAHRRHGVLDRDDEFERNIEPLARKEAKLDGGYRREIGIRNQVGDCKLHA